MVVIYIAYVNRFPNVEFTYVIKLSHGKIIFEFCCIFFFSI